MWIELGCGVGQMRIVLRPLWLLRSPDMIMLLFLWMATVCLVKVAKQLLLQSWPMEMSEPAFNAGKMWPCFAAVESADDSGTMAHCVVLMVVPWATWTLGPKLVLVMLVQWGVQGVQDSGQLRLCPLWLFLVWCYQLMVGL